MNKTETPDTKGLSEFSVKEMEERIGRDKKRLKELNDHDRTALQESIDRDEARIKAWRKEQKGK